MSLEQTTFDPGLTQKYTGKLQRAIEKDGSFNVRKTGLGLKHFHFYQFLINISWPRFFLVILSGYILVNALFACLYLLAGIGNIHGADTSTPLSEFLSTFFLSVHTFTTVGYGTIAPKDVLDELSGGARIADGTDGTCGGDRIALREILTAVGKNGLQRQCDHRPVSRQDEPSIPHCEPAHEHAHGD